MRGAPFLGGVRSLAGKQRLSNNTTQQCVLFDDFVTELQFSGNRGKFPGKFTADELSEATA